MILTRLVLDWTETLKYNIGRFPTRYGSECCTTLLFSVVNISCRSAMGCDGITFGNCHIVTPDEAVHSCKNVDDLSVINCTSIYCFAYGLPGLNLLPMIVVC